VPYEHKIAKQPGGNFLAATALGFFAENLSCTAKIENKRRSEARRKSKQ
jgi:hypothetical protein